VSIEQRMAWRERMIHWLVPRLNGDVQDKEQFLEMFSAAMSEAHNEGVNDAAEVVRRIRAKHPTRELEVAEKALVELERRNRLAGN
jgi:uncharacterized protein (DUF2164 family)